MHAGDGDEADSLDRATRDFLAARPLLFGIAYRVLGSATEAEDIVQEAWLRRQNTDRAGIREPRAFLTTVTARLAINHARSARVRRGSYVGPWLPEPVDTSGDPHLGAERAEALDLAVLFLLEKLNPGSGPPTCSGRRSTTRTGRSRRSSGRATPIRARW